MTIEIKTPTFPESIQDGTIASWHKKQGEYVERDEHVVDIETDKVVLEVVAPASGVLSQVIKQEGDVVKSGEKLAVITEGVGSAKPATIKSETSSSKKLDAVVTGPAARKLARENNIDLEKIAGSGKHGLVTKEDVSSVGKSTESKSKPMNLSALNIPQGERIEKRVPMTRLRKRIAERLLDASQNTAMLTTFNEANMDAVMRLRKKFGEQFEKSHDGTRLGFMSFFVKACVEALKRYPSVNASIDGDDVVYHGYQDIGVAVSTDRRQAARTAGASSARPGQAL